MPILDKISYGPVELIILADDNVRSYSHEFGKVAANKIFSLLVYLNEKFNELVQIYNVTKFHEFLGMEKCIQIFLTSSDVRLKLIHDYDSGPETHLIFKIPLGRKKRFHEEKKLHCIVSDSSSGSSKYIGITVDNIDKELSLKELDSCFKYFLGYHYFSRGAFFFPKIYIKN